MTQLRVALLLGLFLPGPACLSAQGAGPSQWVLERRLRETLEEIYEGARFPGATLGVTLPSGSTLALAVGLADSSGVPMRPNDRMMAGSVGKTFVSALVLRLVSEGRLDLDDPLGRWLGHHPWFQKLPNARAITVRALMNHTSGVPDHVIDPTFLTRLFEDPHRKWAPHELLSYVLNRDPLFDVGGGAHYTDTNYILLGMVIEAVSGAGYYDLLRELVLGPLSLTGIVPVEGDLIPALVQGYPGTLEGALRGYGGDSVTTFTNRLGASPVTLVGGRFVINPQFEWTGGGLATTASDLSRWAKALYEGRVFDEGLLATLLETVRLDIGVEFGYGLGVMVRSTPFGPAYGHTGFFPGYRTRMFYFPEHGFSVAMQFNTNDNEAIGAGHVNRIAATVVEWLGSKSTSPSHRPASSMGAPHLIHPFN